LLSRIILFPLAVPPPARYLTFYVPQEQGECIEPRHHHHSAISHALPSAPPMFVDMRPYIIIVIIILMIPYYCNPVLTCIVVPAKLDIPLLYAY